ncbi:zf-HC2 domain-containing protein [Nocardioides sp. AN3]
MTNEHERYADWDGAYVVGALTPAEHQEYERHLAVCPKCARQLAELLPLPGLLGRVEQADRDALLAGTAPASPPADLERRLLDAARAESSAPVSLTWWRRTRTRVAVGLAAAAAVAAAVVVPVALRDESTPAPAASIALRQVVPSPLSATVALTRKDWGTRIDMTCLYAGGKGSEPSRDYGLYVIDHQGHAHEVSSWWAGPGEEARTTGSTDLSIEDLRAVEIRAADGKTVLLSADV